jgi:hypothetical protein
MIQLNNCHNSSESLIDFVSSSEIKASQIKQSNTEFTKTHSSGDEVRKQHLVSECRSTVGTLKTVVNKLKAAGINPYIMSVMESGYGLPLKHVPPVCNIRNNRSALMSGEFVELEIEKILKLGCIDEVEKSVLHVINGISVAENRSGKKRLVLDFRYVNPCVYINTNASLKMFLSEESCLVQAIIYSNLI